jgi:hypothetical protein
LRLSGIKSRQKRPLFKGWLCNQEIQKIENIFTHSLFVGLLNIYTVVYLLSPNLQVALVLQMKNK